MKFFALALVLMVGGAAPAQAQRADNDRHHENDNDHNSEGHHGGVHVIGGPVFYPSPYPYPAYPYPTYPGSCGYYNNCGYSTATVDCAPEVVEGNVKAADRTLKSLADSSEFSTAAAFKTEMARIASLKTSGAKADQYFAILGINPQDSAAVVEFIGARDAKGAWLNSLQKNADLTATQAESVARTLQKTLRGGLQ